MAAATLQPLYANQATAAPATSALPELPIQIPQMASVNPILPAVGSTAGVGTAPPSRAHAPVTGAPSLAGAAPPPEGALSSAGGAASVIADVNPPPTNWSLPASNLRPGAAPAALVTARAIPPENLILLATNVRSGATPAQESVQSLAEPAASVIAGVNSPANNARINPMVNWSLPANNVRPGAAPGAGAGGTLWSLPSKILQVAELSPQDGCIWRLDSAALPPGACTPMVVFLGPLFPLVYQRQGMEETKRKYVHNLIHRAHRNEDAEQKLIAYLSHVDSLEGRIRQRYDPSECRVTRKELVEMMVLDGLFIIEVLINHWMGKIDKGSASPRVTADTVPGNSDSDFRAPLASTLVPQALREDFTPLRVRWEPHALRFDLIAVPNQIPFFVLEELFQMTEIPELRESEKQPTKLREIILDYLVGDADDDALAGYEGPVYHILHLVYLRLTFSKEEPRVSALQPNAPAPRPLSVVNGALDKLKQKGMDLRALYKRTFSGSSNLPVGWKQWKVIPPLRELVRVGVKLKRAETPRFAQVKFKNGVLEIPAFAWRRYHIRLLTSLVVLEMSGWWPPEKRLFCSYVRFMAELIMNKDDAALLFKKSIVEENNVDDVEKSLICPFLILADFSHGSKYECHFDGLVRDMAKCYQRWSKIGAVLSTQKQSGSIIPQ